MQNPQSHQNRKIYYQMSTSNKSFLNMHYYLKDTGIQNNKFMLALVDPDLAGVDPYDPRLNQMMKQKILRECMANYWYFVREIVRIPDQGGTGAGVKYELHRGNLAYNFCTMLNINIWLELPRQQFKTVSAICRYLYLFNFGTSNSEMTFLNKKMDDSKLNLNRLKELRSALPPYLRMDQAFTKDNKKVKIPDTIEKLQHSINRNIIKTAPSARNKVAAANLLRGRTIPLLWADEWAFIPFNGVIYLNTVPAFKTASLNAKRNNAPYGILLSTTPGVLTTDEGLEAFAMRESALDFNESWYDMSYQQLMELIGANNKSNFVKIIYNYQQLGRTEAWFAEICKDMLFKWEEIRREVLLEWSLGSNNSPFTVEDLEIVSRLVREPIKVVYFLGKYPFNIYQEIEMRNGVPKYPPIIGVDVSGGYNRDASAITCICSWTTKVFAEMNCNYISTPDLATVIHELVNKYMNNAVVNVERNGGFGASVLAKLITSNIKKNLYYEIKDKVIEETNDGTRVVRRTQKTKVYGLDSTKAIRDLLIQILRERMEHHKDKFISKRIYNELLGLEVKRNGRVEHSSNTHDDQIFSYLMALYVWYEGKNLMELFGIQKSTIQTDKAIDEVVFGLEEKYGSIMEEIIELDNHLGINEQLKELERAKGKLYGEWLAGELAKDKQALDNVLSTRPGREAYAREYNIPIEDLEQPGTFRISDSIYLGFNSDGDDDNSSY